MKTKIICLIVFFLFFVGVNVKAQYDIYKIDTCVQGNLKYQTWQSFNLTLHPNEYNIIQPHAIVIGIIDSNVKSVIIDNSVNSWIYDGAIKYKKDNFPVTTISQKVFENCSEIETVSLASGISLIEQLAFHNASSLKNVTGADGVEEIQQYSFSGCSSLEAIPECKKLKKIGWYAFGNNVNLQTVELPESLEDIRHHAFSGCTGMTEVKIGSSVKKVGESIFADCSNIRKVTCTMTNPIEIPENTFDDVVFQNAELVVPEGSLEKYKSTKGWCRFFQETGIDEVKNTKYKINDTSLYNLSGQKVSDSYKGIVIKKGKKIIK